MTKKGAKIRIKDETIPLIVSANTTLKMKSLIVFVAVFGCAFGLSRPTGTGGASTGPQVGILRESNEVNPDGSYAWSFEAENGISAQETGEQKGGDTLEAQGSFQYTAPDGTPIAVQYVANENGFQPQGAHIPEVPAYILRALEWNAAHPEEEEGAQSNKPGGTGRRF